MEGNNKDNEIMKDDAEVTATPIEKDTAEMVENPAVKTTDTTPEMSSEPVVAPAQSTDTKKSAKQYAIAAILIVVAGLAILYALERQGMVNTGIFSKVGSTLSQDAVVATVNEVELSKADYDKNYQQIVASAQQQGLDMTNPQVEADVKKQAIDILINTEILRQVATEAGVVVTPEQVEARYQEVVTSVGGAETLATRMKELGVTEASLRSDIEGEILIQTFITNSVDIGSTTVSQAEIEDTYNKAVENNSGNPDVTIPPLADVQAQIESQLKSAKEQELVNTFIQSLRDKADVKILI